jgi:hypothetical protein
MFYISNGNLNINNLGEQMKHFFTLLVVFMLVLVGTGLTQEVKKTGGFARLQGMGGNPYIMDPFFNTINPAWNAVYNDFLLADIGSSAGSPFSAGGSGQYISGAFTVAKNWTVGGILSRNDFNGFSIALLDPGTNNSLGLPFPGVVSSVNGLVGAGSVVPLDNNVEAIGTFTTGNTSIGFGVAYANTTNDFTPPTGTGTSGVASQIGVNLGVLSNLTSTFKLDAGVSLVLPSASYKPSTGNETKASQTFILANVRAFWNLNQNLKLVPIAVFATASGKIDSGGTSSGSADMISFTEIGVGVGLNYQVGNFLLAGGATFNTFSATQEAVPDNSPELKASANIFPIWNIGAEWNMLDWFVARLGYVAFSGSATLQFPASTTTTSETVRSFFTPSQRGVTLGVGFRFGDFSLDATVNEDVLRQGLNTIGGNGATFAYLTSSYALP